MADRPGDLPPITDGLLDTGDLLARLDRWVAAARVGEAAESRSREHWLRRVADESASFEGVLVDLAERGTGVVVSGVADRRHRGFIVGVGTDFVLLRTTSGSDVLLASRCLTSVQAEVGSNATLGDREFELELDICLAEALAALADDRPRVLVIPTTGADSTVGELRSVGRDVLQIRLDGSARSTAYVPIANVAEVRMA